MPIIRINEDTAQALRELATPEEVTADDVVRRLAGLVPKERAKGWVKGKPRQSRWPFTSLEVGGYADLQVPVPEAAMAAVRRAERTGKKFHVPTSTTTGIIRVTRIA